MESVEQRSFDDAFLTSHQPLPNSNLESIEIDHTSFPTFDLLDWLAIFRMLVIARLAK